MAEVIEMPKLSDTMEEGVLEAWHVKVGDTVTPDDVLADVATDKATMEVPAYFDGTVLHLEGEPGDAIPLGKMIAIIGEKGEDISGLLAKLKGNGAANASAPAALADAPAPTSAPQATAASADDVNDGDERLKISPLARKMAEELKVDLRTLSGSGEGGRIVRRDIEAAAEKSAAPAAPVAQAPIAASASQAKVDSTESAQNQVVNVPAPPAGTNYTEHRVSQMRKTIARRLSESKFTAPHFYLSVTIDMEKAQQFREALKIESPEAKVSFNDLIIKAVAVALRKHPAVNSSWLGDTIRQHHDIHIGVAVAVEDGLMVPVVTHADRRGLTDISATVTDLAKRARDKKLKPEEMQGNTFSISNLGMFGIEEFTAIINPPDACILAVGAIQQVPAVRNGELVIARQMKVTLSCDHRIVDGATGAQFLGTFRYLLENPMRLLL